MGVAGTGKTTVGRALAHALGWPFRDADEFHPAANIAKMAAGTPLSDADRQPWLAAIRAFIDGRLSARAPVIVTCSALRESYRQTLGVDRPGIRLVYLAGSADLIRERLRHRPGHFMKPAMLDSQLAILEPPQHALTIDVAAEPDAIVAEIRRNLSL
jgi:gluconokinase